MTSASPDPVKAHAQMEDPNKRQDDFDMAKLKKSLKHEQRRSLMSKNKVAKLTPAEIRSLNHSATASKAGSVRSVDDHSARRLWSSTPPLTPDHHSPSHQLQHRASTGGQANSNLPTPPLSPDRERRGSSSSTRYIHAPKPISHAQANQFANAASHSRPPSATSYRGVPTYRGPEITRTGSLTMLHTPSQDIVSNPLSQFSRPRQSTLMASPQKSAPDQRPSEDIVSPIAVKPRLQSLGGMSQGPSRDHSPIRPSDSPVSMEDGKTPEKNDTQTPTQEEALVIQVSPKAQPDASDCQDEPPKKQKLTWRRTTTGSPQSEAEPTLLRKEYRRRTLMSSKHGYCLHGINYADTKPGPAPEMRDSLRDQLPSSKTAEYKKDHREEAVASTEYGQHPAVRPLEAGAADVEAITHIPSDSSPSSGRKGKEREIEPIGDIDTDTNSIASSVPSYSRCSCCGRIQKPGGFESELSPVLENENLRTNFNFEVERTSPANHRRRSSSISSNQRKFVHIIPMEIGNEMKQARIEPMKESTPSVMSSESVPSGKPRGVAVNKPGDIIGPSSMPLAIMPRPKETPKFVRFGSLHMKKDEQQEVQHNIKQDQAQKLAPPQQPQLQRFGSLYGFRNDAQQAQKAQPSDVLPMQQPVQSAYQAQRARQPLPSQPNGHQPARPSRLAYQYNAPSTPIAAIEKPLGDSPTSSRNETLPLVSPQFSDNSEGPVVDLSSFDGSFVQNSLSRSATFRETSPPSSSNGMFNQPSSIGSYQLLTKVAMPVTNGGSTDSFAQAAAQDPPHLSSSVTNMPTPIDTRVSDTTRTNGQRPSASTVVRIIPSNPVSGTSSPSSTSSKGPLKLGDWILPKNPQMQTQSAGENVSSNRKDIGIAV